MDSVIVFGLLALQFIGLALLLVALPTFVGLMAWDVISDIRARRAAAADEAEVEIIEPVRPVVVRGATRLTA